jgi:hypothetical protein
MDQAAGVMKKCTLCVDRIYNDNLPEEDRFRPVYAHAHPARGILAIWAMIPPRCRNLWRRVGAWILCLSWAPSRVNKYLPPRPKDVPADLDILAPYFGASFGTQKGFLGWLDKALEKL